MAMLLLLGLSSILAHAVNTWEEGSTALLGFDRPANTCLPLGLEGREWGEGTSKASSLSLRYTLPPLSHICRFTSAAANNQTVYMHV